MSRAIVLAVVGLLGSLLPAGAIAASDGPRPVAIWRLNEGPKTSVARDSSKPRHPGRVGRKVRTGREFPGATGYRFPRLPRDSEQRLGHLVRVRDADRLDPKLGRFSIAFRFRTHRRDANLIQKGQSGVAGGLWKVEFNRGVLACMFRDRMGRTNTATSVRRVNHGKWHTARCVRTPHSVTLFLDGERRQVHVKRTGRIDNGAPVSIGGKRFCGGKVDCDYWSGKLDWVKIRRG